MRFQRNKCYLVGCGLLGLLFLFINVVPALAVDHSRQMVWTKMTSGTTVTLNDVWGSAVDDIFAVGNYGTILHYDGVSWTPMTSGTTEDLMSVWGSGPSNVIAVGDDGTQIRYDGVSWRAMGAIPHPTGEIVTGVSGNSSGDVYCGTYGGRVQIFDRNWEDDIIFSGMPFLNDIHVSENGHVYTAGIKNDLKGGAVAYWNLYGFWQGPATFDNTRAFSGVWGDDNFVYFVGIDYTPGVPGTSVARIWRVIDDAAWSNWTIPSIAWLGDVWGPGMNNVFMVGADGNIIHFNGSGAIDSITGTTESLHGIWGCSETDVFAVGAGGTILRYAGQLPVKATLLAPANGVERGSEAVRFYWNPVDGATDYWLQAAYDQAFSQLAFDGSVGNALMVSLNPFPCNDTPIYWRVRGGDSLGWGAFSDTWSFTSNTLGPPTLEAPFVGSFVNDTSVTFGWQPVAGATHYALQIASDPAFSSLIFFNYVYNHQVNISGFPNDGTVYYWRVVSINNSTWGNYWSLGWFFTNGPQ